MKITVCIGSACHLKGSRQIVEEFQYLIRENNLKETVDLGGKFCMGKCDGDVAVTVDGKYFSVKPENAKAFFDKEILPKAAKK